MKITHTEKVEGGYNVHFENVDMVAFVHEEKEIEDLRKQGFIEDKLNNKSKKSTRKDKGVNK